MEKTRVELKTKSAYKKRQYKNKTNAKTNEQTYKENELPIEEEVETTEEMLVIDHTHKCKRTFATLHAANNSFIKS